MASFSNWLNGLDSLHLHADNEDNSGTGVLGSEVVAPPNNVAVDSLDLSQDSDVYTLSRKDRQKATTQWQVSVIG